MNAKKHSSLLRAALFAATAVLVPAATLAPALAQPTSNDPRERAKWFYAEGRKNYDLGNFDKAVENFKKAYEEMPDGAFLFNIAQAYRQLNDCKNALFFYKRFLSVKKDAPETTKKEVEGHIIVLEECVKKQEDIRSRPPDGTEPPGTGGVDGGTGGGTTGGTGGGTAGGTGGTGGGTTGGTGDGRVGGLGGGGGDDGDDDDDDDDDGVASATPKVLAAHASFGGAKVGAGSLDVPIQLAVSITAGYPIKLNDKLVLDAGAGFAFTPVPWSAAAVDGTASMTGVFANLGATYEVAPKIAVRGELGGGMMFLGGLEMGNPFTVGGAPTTGALGMPLFRAGLTGEYAFTKNVAAAVTPIAFSISPAKEGMKDEIGSLTRLEFTVGLGYRM